MRREMNRRANRSHRWPADQRARSGRWCRAACASVVTSDTTGGLPFCPAPHGIEPAGYAGRDDQAFATSSRRAAAFFARFAAWYASSASGESTSPRHGRSGQRGSATFTPSRFASVDPRADHLHVPESRERADPLLELGAVGLPSSTAGSHRRRTRPRRPRTAPVPASPCSPGKRWIAGFSRKTSLSRFGVEGCDLRRVELTETLLELERAGEGLLHGDLLIEREADQQRERALGEETVGGGDCR